MLHMFRGIRWLEPSIQGRMPVFQPFLRIAGRCWCLPRGRTLMRLPQSRSFGRCAEPERKFCRMKSTTGSAPWSAICPIFWHSRSAILLTICLKKFVLPFWTMLRLGFGILHGLQLRTLSCGGIFSSPIGRRFWGRSTSSSLTHRQWPMLSELVTRQPLQVG